MLPSTLSGSWEHQPAADNTRDNKTGLRPRGIPGIPETRVTLLIIADRASHEKGGKCLSSFEDEPEGGSLNDGCVAFLT